MTNLAKLVLELTITFCINSVLFLYFFMFGSSFWRTNLLFIYGFLVLLFAFFSFFWNYNYPNSSQWDEVYHIASSEKYLTNSVFMESHPPLGKMFIALGEKILNPNAKKSEVNPIARLCFSQNDWEKRPEIIDKTSFLKTDQIQGYPDGYSFCGVRLMPVLFAMFTAPLFFFLLFLLVRNLHLALLFSSLFVFDNAIILQSRAAMVDSIQIFFIVLAICYFVFKLEQILGNLPNDLTNLFPNLKLETKKNTKLLVKLSDKIANEKNLSFNKSSQTSFQSNSDLLPSQNNDQTSAKDKSTNDNEKSNNLSQKLEKESINISKKLTTNSNNNLQTNLKNLSQIHKFSWQNYLLLGIFCGLSIVTKHNAAIILVLPIAWFLFEICTNRINLQISFLYQKFTKQFWIGIISLLVFIFLNYLLIVNLVFLKYSFIFNLPENLVTNYFIGLIILAIFLSITGLIFGIIKLRTNIIFQDWLQTLIKIASFSFGLAFLYLSVFSIHIANGQKVVTESNNRSGYYLASDFYKEKLNQNQMKNPLNWPISFWDNWLYMAQYHKGVPNLDLCKRDDKGNLTENGSYPITWPVMNRTISFRWEWGTKDGSTPKDNKYVRYSYLIGNPLIWGIGLFSIILSLVLIISYLFLGLPLRNKRIFHYILALSVLYLAYMIGVLSVERVMYLYHYLIPLIFTLILAALLFVYNFGELDDNYDNLAFENFLTNSKFDQLKRNNSDLKQILPSNQLQLNEKDLIKNTQNQLQNSQIEQNTIGQNSLKNNSPQKNQQNLDSGLNLEPTLKVKISQDNLQTLEKENSPYFWHYLILVCCLLLIFTCFAFFSPFTYYQPLSREEFLMRNWFSFWQMRVVN